MKYHRLVWPGLGLALLLGLPWLAEIIGEPHLIKLASRMVIMALAALALDLALGVGGMVSFGHAAFLGIGGYAAGVAFQHDFQGTAFLGLAVTTDILVLAPVAMAASALFAAVTGVISLRCRGVAFIMITLAFAQMLYFLFVSLRYYNGEDGIALWSRSTFAGTDLLENSLFFYHFCLALLVIALLIAHRLLHAPFGRMLKAAAGNPLRMQALGVAPDGYRLVAYIISGAMTGLAGLLLANSGYFVGPSFMSWQNSGHLIIMVVMGGAGTLFGPVLGAFAFIALEEWLPPLIEQIAEGRGQHWRIVFGPLLVVIALYARGGLWGLIERTGGRR